MTLGDLLQLVNLKLGEQSLFYPPEEVLRQGLNPAQRLLCLVYPRLLLSRLTTTVDADLPFLDLRTVSTSIRKIERVFLGDVTGESSIANVATGEAHELTETTVMKLSSQRNWLAQKGTIEHYWLWGPHWLGLFRRPIATTTITLIFKATPTPLVFEVPTGVPDVAAVYHPVLAEIATGLLLLKEGGAESQRGLQRIMTALNMDQQKQRMA